MTVRAIAPVNPYLAETFAPPVMEARRWVEETTFSPDLPLINVAQAAPTESPPESMREAMAEAIMHDPQSHLYGAVLGLDSLRQEVATHCTTIYGGPIIHDQVAITSGCNQAFCATISSLAGPGDAVILPAPWYFNHKMWLSMSGIECRVLMCGDDMLPDPEAAKALVDDRVKAIVLVSPNNPCGVEYPPELISAFYDVAQQAGISLVVDETYRDFHSKTGAPHGLFTDPDWGDTLIQLYSFSKAYRLTGHRVGAIVTSVERMAEIEKFLDTMTICPNQLGQMGALYGMRNLADWVAGERLEILDRRSAMAIGFPSVEGWKMKGCGAYFGYVEHPFDAPSNEVARKLVKDAAVLALPGTMFSPTLQEGGTGHAEKHFRFAFANVDRAGIESLFDRLRGFSI